MYLLCPEEPHSEDNLHTWSLRAQKKLVLLESDLLLLFPNLQGQYSRPLTLATFLGTPAPHHCRCHDPCINRITNTCSQSVSANLSIFINASLCPPAIRSHKNQLFSIGSSETAACPQILVSIIHATHSVSQPGLCKLCTRGPQILTVLGTQSDESVTFYKVSGVPEETLSHTLFYSSFLFRDYIIFHWKLLHICRPH